MVKMKFPSCFQQLLIVFACLLENLYCYRPLVLIHGINSDYKDLSDIEAWAQADFPGIQTFSLDAFNNDYSIVSMRTQVPEFVTLLKNITDHYGTVDLLGYSQGGIVARGVVEEGDNKNINNFISLSAPGLGEYGIPFLNDTSFFDHVTAGEVYHICYTKSGQLISVCNYWHDPIQTTLYLAENNYLPYLNNELAHNDSQRYKENFVSLGGLILVGGPTDEVIQPWQTAQYSFWDADLNVIPYNQLHYYTQDTFGLKTLDDQGKLKFCTVSGVQHTKWPHTKSVYDTCIRPYIAN
ncbi:lysosomal thioesterase PPT2-B-like [Symsagittifera roscoffensis]|uniref:lysosomal thioesterase PPT2-B-like n=1 Tax=Symsagittifera roscoffensis TaxID=84072 RepID=UPI00307C5F73